MDKDKNLEEIIAGMDLNSIYNTSPKSLKELTNDFCEPLVRLIMVKALTISEQKSLLKFIKKKYGMWQKMTRFLWSELPAAGGYPEYFYNMEANIDSDRIITTNGSIPVESHEYTQLVSQQKKEKSVDIYSKVIADAAIAAMKTPQKNDSDFEHMKAWKDNPDLDYYLSEEHWNHHVNTLLYNYLLGFHEGKEVGAFLNPTRDSIPQPINDYTRQYGEMFNEAYRLCHIVLTSPVPETKVALLASEAAKVGIKRLFGNSKDQYGNPVSIDNLLPNVIDLIESYHILGMVNSILTLANDQNAAVDRFLIALSVYQDNGMCFCGYIHCFKPYNEAYQAFIVATIIDGSYLRPGYDNKSRDEYLRKNIPWYKNLTNELEKRKQKSEEEMCGEGEDDKKRKYGENCNRNTNVFDYRLNEDKIARAVKKLNRNGLGQIDFTYAVQNCFESLEWLSDTMDTHFVAWMKKHRIINMKTENLKKAKSDSRTNEVKNELLKILQEKNEETGKPKDKIDFYIRDDAQLINDGD